MKGAIELAAAGDEAAYSSLVDEAPEHQRRALKAVVNVVLDGKRFVTRMRAPR